VSPDAAVVQATQRQLDRWRAALESGATRVGWKIGFNLRPVQEALGLERPVIGHLTSATLVGADGVHSLAGAQAPLVEPEIAVEIGPEKTIARLAPALEVVDMSEPPGSPDALPGAIEGNVFHRAVAFGRLQDLDSTAGVEALLSINGEERGRADASAYPLADMIHAVRDRLEEAGESLEPGDHIIAGTLTPPQAVAAGDRVAVDLGRLGRLEVEFVS
jgi:2-keto-4-pentenoate hydratase